MRRLVLILALLALTVGSTGCQFDCCDFMHPRPVQSTPSCDCLPCGQRPDYSERGSYP